MTAEYTVNAYDMVSNRFLGALPFSSLSFERVLNGAGNLTMVVPYTLGVPELLPARVRLVVYRNDVPVWSGVLWKRKREPDGLTLDAGEMLQYLDRILVRENLSFAQVDQSMIFAALVQYAQSKPGAHTGIQIVGATETGVYRDRTYLASERSPVGDLLRNLTGIINGIDFISSPILSGGVTVDRFLLGYPRLGRTWPDSRVVLEVGGNCAVTSWEEDGYGCATVTDAVGATPEGWDTPLIAGVAAGFMYTGGWPRMESVVTYNDVSEWNTLLAYAIDNEAVRSATRVAASFEVYGTDPEFGTYLTGDDCRVRIPPGPTFPNGLDQVMRLATIKIDATDGERVTMEMAPALVDGDLLAQVPA